MNKYEQKFINDVNEKYGTGTYLFDNMKYTNAHNQVELFCTKGNHPFFITPMQIVRKQSKGCNICTKNTAYDLPTFIEKVKVYYPYLTFEKTTYVPQRLGNMVVTCHANPNDVHDWEVNSKTLLVGKTQCGVCSGKGGRDTSRFILEATKIHSDKYTYTKCDYINSDTKVLITCPEHGDFTQIPKSHLNGRGCPKCGKYGYQPNNPGYFYVQKLESPTGTVYKYGITGDMTRRITEQSRNSVYTHTVLVERYFEDGKQALVLEKFMKTFIASGVSTIEELPSGFTETFDAQYLNVVLEIVNSFNSKEED